MTAPTFSLLIPTAGRETLRRCLDSVRPQLRYGDEVLVIGDTHDGPLPEVEALVRAYGPPFRYVPFDGGHHCWGHCGLNHGLTLARGDYLNVNDDDDVWSPHALATMRRVIRRHPRPRPFLFRFQSWYGPVFWDQRGVAENHIGGHCAVFPNLPDRLGRFTCRYQGDFDFIRSTLDLWPHGERDAVWVDQVIAVARPKAVARVLEAVS